MSCRKRDEPAIHQTSTNPESKTQTQIGRERIQEVEWRRNDRDRELVKALEQADDAIRARAAQAIGRAGFGIYTDDILKHLQDSSAQVRRESAFALRLIAIDDRFPQREKTAPRVYDALFAQFQREQDAASKRELMRAIGAVLAFRVKPESEVPADAATVKWVRDKVASWIDTNSLSRKNNAQDRDLFWALGFVGRYAPWAIADQPKLDAFLRSQYDTSDGELRFLAAWVSSFTSRSLWTPSFFKATTSLLDEGDPGKRTDDAVLAMTIRALGKAFPSVESGNWIGGKLNHSDIDVQVEVAKALAHVEMGTASLRRLTETLPLLWSGISDNFLRLTGKHVHAIWVALEALEPRAKESTVRALARELWDLTEVSDSAVTYGEREAHSINLIHCGAAKLLDLADGEPSRVLTCGTAKTNALDEIYRDVLIASTIAKFNKPKEEQLEFLDEYLRHDAKRVRRAALRAALIVENESKESTQAQPKERALPDLQWAGDKPLPTKAVLVTQRGEIVLNLFSAETPATVANFARLAAKQFYKGLRFHRVVPNFVVQGGDPDRTGDGGPGYTIPCELTAKPYRRGSVGMALSGRDTGGSQFFIATTRIPHLDGQYTQFAEVISGMEFVDQILPEEEILDLYIKEEK